MIESVYTNTAGEGTEYRVTGRRPPKNVCQSGFFTGDFRVYLEDYVHTFTHWLAEQDHSTRCAAVLIGEFAQSEHNREVYISGSVVAEKACVQGGIEMTPEVWKQVYETIKEYFPEGEIVGWFYGGTSFIEEERMRLEQVHLDHFAGTDRVLMLYDFLEGEEEFYRYENGELTKQTGYYIYYEKNTEMQNYMIDKKQGKDLRERVEDRAVKEMRNRLNVTQEDDTELGEDGPAPQRPEWRKPAVPDSGSRFLYTAGIVLAAIAVIMGASMIYNQERLKGFEQTLNEILGQAAEDGKQQADNGDAQGSIFDTQQTQEVFGPQGGQTLSPSPEISPTPSAKASPTPVSPEGYGDGDVSPAPSDMENEPMTEDTPGAEANTPTAVPQPEDGQQQGHEAAGTVIDPSQCTIYIVQRGDTLSSICKQHYGNLEKLDQIKDMNQINDEYLIYVNQELLLP